MRLIIILFYYLMLSSCASIVNIDYDKNVNFKLLTAYRIESTPVRISADTRINSPFMRQRVVRAIETSFLEKGYKKSEKKVDFHIKY